MPRMKTHSDDVLMKTGKMKHVDRSASLAPSPYGRANKMRKADESPQKQGYVMYENFNGWDGESPRWLPEGWEVDHRGDCSLNYTWCPLEPSIYYPTLADGQYCLCVPYAEENQDEWLITPEIMPADNMLLTYYMRMNPFYFYDTHNLNYITKEYEGGKITVYTIQILIKEEGGEWELLRDYAEEFMDYSYRDLREATNNSALVKQTVDLKEYGGKKVRIAFRYLGKDGDLMMLDAVGVGYRTLDDVWYMEPVHALYWGYSRNSDFSQTKTDISLYPANTPITWINMSGEDAAYSWQYPDGPASVITEDPDELSLAYAPERPGQIPVLFSSPELHASAPERVDRIYRSPVEYFQIGGSPTYNADNRTLAHTLFQFPMNHLDVAFKDVRDNKLGAYSVPVYGHNEFTNDYWLNYSLNGEEPMEGNYSHLIGIGNVYFASSDAPLVVGGISVYGWGRVWDEAELTATIYALDEDMHTDYDTFTVVARATLQGKDIQAMFDRDSKDYLYLPFSFDEPAVIQASEEHPAFLIMLEGFNSDKVDYFAPLHNYAVNETGYSAGYMLHEINLLGHIEEGAYRSLKTTRYMDNGTYVDHPLSFAIGLDAEYPWLTAEVDEIEIRPDEDSVSVNLNSYYDGSELNIDAPEGLTATLSGRYDECLLTVAKSDAEKSADGQIRITGPGVALAIAVKDLTPNAVSSVSASTDIVSVYDMSGREISSADAAGVYIVKYADGKIRKVTIK